MENKILNNNSNSTELASIKVCVRVRPFNDREKKLESQNIIEINKNATTIIHPSTLHLPSDQQHKQTYYYDHSFWSFNNETQKSITQQDIYQTIGQPIIKNLFDGYNSCIMAYGQTGCLAPDTLVRMYDGSLKKVQDIQVGDLVMGDNSSSRKVMELYSGKSFMYQIQSISAKPYQVNKDHILTLGYQNGVEYNWDEHKQSYIVSWNHGTHVKYFTIDSPLKTKSSVFKEMMVFCETIKEKQKVMDLSVSDYIKKPLQWKQRYQSVQASIEFPDVPVPLSPYLFGVWLTSPISLRNKQTIECFKDQEVEGQIKNFLIDSNPNYNSTSIIIKKKQQFYWSLTLNEKSFLTDHDLFITSYIPKQYLINSRQQRLLLLAGILDSKGFLNRDCCKMLIDHEEELFIDKVIELSRSLGFLCLKKRISKRYKSQHKKYFRCELLGTEDQIYSIPFKAQRLKSFIDNWKLRYSYQKIQVKSKGIGSYYGFLLDGNQRFLLEDYTVTHNSGKSFSMMGGNQSEEVKGLIPRIGSQLFSINESQPSSNNNNNNISNNNYKNNNTTTQYQISISYFEIYAEQIRDLIHPENNKNLKVRENPETGPYVEDLSVIQVQDYLTLEKYMNMGNKNRITAPTKMNDQSSRSHAVFIIYVTQVDSQTLEIISKSKLYLVDLAGSERVKDSGVTGVGLKEAANINTSLTTLGRVISILSEQENKHHSTNSTNSTNSTSFVPFRDSVLTWLLKDSLGGNSKTVMLAAISPSHVNYDETLSTLKYAYQAKKIVNKVSNNIKNKSCIFIKIKEDLLKFKQQLFGDENNENNDEINQPNQTMIEKNITSNSSSLSSLSLFSSLQDILQKKQSVQEYFLQKPLNKYNCTIEEEVKYPCLIKIFNQLDKNIKDVDENWVIILDQKLNKNILELCEIEIKPIDNIIIIIPKNKNTIKVNGLFINEPSNIKDGDIIDFHSKMYKLKLF